MRIHPDSPVDLTYCTNIHPADGWQAVRENVFSYAPALKAEFSPQHPFGVGLRLSNRESCELLTGDALPQFREDLQQHGLYVALINGFPYGPFHKQTVKADVYAPDWRNPERAAYTKRLAAILDGLLPDGMDGGISTCPLAYNEWIDDPNGDMDTMAVQLAGVVKVLAEIESRSGRFLHLDIEPEPDCLLESSSQLVHFFEEHVLCAGRASLAQAVGCTTDKAEALLRRHLSVCLDTCHAAVLWEPIESCLANYRRAGIAIGRVQISSALDVKFAGDPGIRNRQLDHLGTFADPVYLHQVVARLPGGETLRYHDLEPALADENSHPAGSTWRIHFHVPLHQEQFGNLGSTRSAILDTLRHLGRDRFTTHLEIETYTWDVMPTEYRSSLLASLTREFEWLTSVLPDRAL